MAARKAANAKAGHAAALRPGTADAGERSRPGGRGYPGQIAEGLADLRADRATATNARDAAVHRLHANRAALEGMEKTLRALSTAREKRAMWNNLSKTIGTATWRAR